MLSYRHSFHAGNFADLLKHIVLVEILEHLIKKDKPFDYIDTHSGAGLYSLTSQASSKLAEYKTGIGIVSREKFPELASYFETVAAFNEGDALACYPGSPCIAKTYLRHQDKAWLFELHPADFQALKNNVSGKKNVRVQCCDGMDGLAALLPPASRRGLVLIDPSYEIKSEYQSVVDRLIQLHKKFSYGIFALWYPVVDRRRIERIEKKLIASGIRNIQRFELGIADDTAERGMTSSGMIVVNPPWQLYEKMSLLLPKLARQITSGERAVYKCDVLCVE